MCSSVPLSRRKHGYCSIGPKKKMARLAEKRARGVREWWWWWWWWGGGGHQRGPAARQPSLSISPKLDVVQFRRLKLPTKNHGYSIGPRKLSTARRKGLGPPLKDDLLQTELELAQCLLQTTQFINVTQARRCTFRPPCPRRSTATASWPREADRACRKGPGAAEEPDLL